MPERLSDKLREFLQTIQGREITLKELRGELKIDPTSPEFDSIRVYMFNLVKERIVKPSGRKDGVYKVITQVNPVQVFGVDRKEIPPFELFFPRDFETQIEMDFAESVVIREGDIVLIGGVSNLGKTTLAMNFCAENIDKRPVLMGNEYTTPELEPTPRFFNRLKVMDWITWTNDGKDKFTLLPVREDYAEHIIKDRINIIDWVNLEGDKLYAVSQVMQELKKQIGKGVIVMVLQKGENTQAARGGQFTKDFTDLEILLDKYSETETLLTIGKVKEYTKPVVGKTYAFGILQGVKIVNFREVKKCKTCFGRGFTKSGECSICGGKKFVDA